MLILFIDWYHISVIGNKLEMIFKLVATPQNRQHHQVLQSSEDEDPGKDKIPLSPRISPVGTDTEVQTENVCIGFM